MEWNQVNLRLMQGLVLVSQKLFGTLGGFFLDISQMLFSHIDMKSLKIVNGIVFTTNKDNNNATTVFVGDAYICPRKLSEA